MGPQYTSCVDADDYTGLNYAYLAVLGVIAAFGGLGALLTGGLLGGVAALAFLEGLRHVLDYLLHGKLICLQRDHSKVDCICGGVSGRTVCAIGEIADTENVGEDKNPVEDIDDDYAINLVLFPVDMNEFAAKPYVDRSDENKSNAYKQELHKIATGPGHLQGDLITRQQGRHGRADEFGYLRTMVSVTGDYFPYTSVVGRDAGSEEDIRWTEFVAKNNMRAPKRFKVPVLHCEFEGSREHDMLDALEGFPFGTSFCKKNFLTKLACRIVAAVLAPVTLAAVSLAWARNTEGTTEGTLVDGGVIGPKARVIVKGSWVYDTGHSGWNEMHAVRIVQRVCHEPRTPAELKDFLHTWCERLAETPTSEGAGNGPYISVGVNTPQDNPAAVATLIAQAQPENQWTYHPLIDGCRPADEPPPPPGGPPPVH
jgi:hypothetical protein